MCSSFDPLWAPALPLHSWLFNLDSPCHCTSNGWIHSEYNPDFLFFFCLSFLSHFLLFVIMYRGFSWSSRSPMWYSVMNSVSCVCFSERYSKAYFKHALGVRNLHFTALLLWIKVTSYSRSLICLSCPNSCNHLLS